MAASVTVRMRRETREYLKAVALTKRLDEPDLLREIIDEFVDPYRGNPAVERARREARRYGLIKQG
jgi:hypothetical protein